MNRSFLAVLLFGCQLLFPSALSAQTIGMTKSVMLRATVQATVPVITLHWEPVTGAQTFLVYRKAKTAVAWGNAFPTLPADATSFADATAEVGVAYEYRVVKTSTTSGPSYGYILSGYQVPPEHREGSIALVVDTTHLTDFADELSIWKEDHRLSGWNVLEILVSPTDSVTTVKNRILQLSQQFNDLKTLFLFGHVPVPYSGRVYPDGHTPQHEGAWPADGFYAELNGNWTDQSVNISAATEPRNRNIPGDGKFDQNVFPGQLELQIGRVDMNSLSNGSESVLLQKYLRKAHRFREGLIPVRERALIDDNIPDIDSEGFAAAAWRSFSSTVGIDSIVTTDYFTTMRQSSCLWSYGCGYGNYTTCTGVGVSGDYVIDSLENIFTMTFGSYFGDWDNPNNFLRSALTGGAVLSNVWSARPHSHFHQMALGESIGFSMFQNMSNTNAYENNMFPKGIYMALMGDPTVKSYPVRHPQSISADLVGEETQVTWTSVPGVDGYFLYVRPSDSTYFSLVNAAMITDTSFTIECAEFTGELEYMVRACKLKNGNSGSYYALSTGISDTLITTEIEIPIASIESEIDQNIVTFTAPVGSFEYGWDFGDGNQGNGQSITHEFPLDNATYVVSLIMQNACLSDTAEASIVITIGGFEAVPEGWWLYPVPAKDQLRVKAPSAVDFDFEIFDITGRKCQFGKGNSGVPVSVADLSPGFYWISLRTMQDRQFALRFVKE